MTKMLNDEQTEKKAGTGGQYRMWGGVCGLTIGSQSQVRVSKQLNRLLKTERNVCMCGEKGSGRKVRDGKGDLTRSPVFICISYSEAPTEKTRFP